jgi:hypothetical protein
MSSFYFVTNNTLQSNLDVALNHVNELVAVSESKDYVGKPVQVSSFRKTIIIHIAAIVEALLLWRLEQEIKSKRVELEGEWKYPDPKILYEISDSEQIVAGKRHKERGSMDRLNFLQIIKLCEKYEVLKSGKLRGDVDKVRVYRNKQHLGGLGEVEHKYSKHDLEFCFNVADRVKNVVSK